MNYIIFFTLLIILLIRPITANSDMETRRDPVANKHDCLSWDKDIENNKKKLLNPKLTPKERIDILTAIDAQQQNHDKFCPAHGNHK